jgi:predicted pyridoxine 5'-phosphate oxidase superfamily flavin-nucleotide-binding protein
MRPFNADELHTLSHSVLCWLATANAQGQPNVSPKEVFSAQGEHGIVLAHIASPTSVANIRVQPRVCLSMVDVFTQRGHKFVGTAKVIAPDDEAFAMLAPPLLAMTGGRFELRAIIHVLVDQIAPILAPSYRMIPGTTEAGQVESALRTYGVRRGDACGLLPPPPLT